MTKMVIMMGMVKMVMMMIKMINTILFATIFFKSLLFDVCRIILIYFDKNCDNLTDLDGCPVFYLDREVSKFTQNFIKYICHL